MSQRETKDCVEKVTADLEECQIGEELHKSLVVVLSASHDLSILAKFPKPKFRIPPIFLHKPVKFGPLMSKVLNLGIKFYYPVVRNHYTKICCQSLDDHKALVEYFKSRQLPHHTYGYPRNKLMKVVLRGLPNDVDLDQFKKQLELVSIPIVRLHKMHNLERAKDLPLLILVVVPNDEKGRKILLIKQYLGHSVTLEPPKPRSIQCYRCQKWGHAQRYCNGLIKCVKCAGDHMYQNCGRDPAKMPPKCANCNSDHTSNYKLCPYCPDSPQYEKKMCTIAIINSMFPGIPARPKTPVTIENHHEFFRGRV